MNIKRKYNIEKTSYPLDGIYNYNAQVWLSVDGGETFCYAGIGKFAKTKEEAQAWCEKYERDHKLA